MIVDVIVCRLTTKITGTVIDNLLKYFVVGLNTGTLFYIIYFISIGRALYVYRDMNVNRATAWICVSHPPHVCRTSFASVITSGKQDLKLIHKKVPYRIQTMGGQKHI